MDLVQLELLNLSHNNINEIHCQTFKNLSEVKTLDLSHNKISTLETQWWRNLYNLEELYLAGNFFEGINDGPKLEIKKLKVRLVITFISKLIYLILVRRYV